MLAHERCPWPSQTLVDLSAARLFAGVMSFLVVQNTKLPTNVRKEMSAFWMSRDLVSNRLRAHTRVPGNLAKQAWGLGQKAVDDGGSLV